MPPRRFRLAVAAALFFVFTIWGSTYLAIRVALESFPPLLMAGIRFTVAGSFLFCVLRLRGAPLPRPKEWGASAIVGALLFGLGNGAVAVGEQRIGSGVAAVVVATMPLWAALFASLWGERPSRGEVLAIVLGIVGVAVLNAGGDFSGHGWSTVALSIAPMAWALGSVWGKRLPLPEGLMGTATPMMTSGLLLSAAGLLAGEHVPAAPSATAVGALIYLITFGSLIGFSAYMFLLRNTRPVTATSYAYVNPLVAVALGVAFGGEAVGIPTFVGAAIILAAVGVLTLTRAKRKAPNTGGGPTGAPSANAAVNANLTPVPSSR